MKTTTIATLDTTHSATVTLTQWDDRSYTASVDHKGSFSKDFTNKREALAWVRGKVGRISLRRSC